MTSPLVSPDPIDQGGNDAADKLSRLVAGNNHLVTHPHLVSALLDANATPEQAQAINMFVGGLSAKGRVEAARASGTKISLSPEEQSALGAIKVNYSDVQYTQQDAEADIQKALGAQSGQPGGATLTHSSGGSSGLLGDIWGGVTDAADAVGTGLSKAANFTGATLAHTGENFVHGIEDMVGAGGGGGGQNAQLAADAAQAHDATIADAQARAMRVAGYDPDNPLSVIAYRASGKDTLDISALYSNHDPALVDEAIKYADDPKGYIERLVQGNDTGLLNQLKTQQFQDLVTQVNSHRATVGNLLTEGIDPKKHPEVQKLLASGIDTAVLFATDPTLAALGAVKAVKMSKLLLDGVGDAEKVRGILDGSTKGMYASQVRRGVQSLLDNTKVIREGLAAGDDTAVAAGYARIRATTPGLEHLASDFLGGTRATGFDLEKGLTFDKAAPITTMGEAADYLSSTVGLVRVRAGRPLVESSLMPGQLSRFGFRKLRGNLAAGAAARGVRRDSKLVFDLNNVGVASRVLAEPDNAVDVASGRIFVDNGDGSVSIISSAGVGRGTLQAGEDGSLHALHEGGVTELSRLDDGSLVEKGATGTPPDVAPSAPTSLASQARAQHGEIGQALFDARKGVGLGAVAARSRLLAQRIASFLPRTTTFATDDPNAVQRVFQYGRMYLTNGHANLLAAAYAAGDEGARKAILKGMELQTLHAAGLGTTEAGRGLIQEAERSLDDARYASAPGGIDDIIDPATGEPMRAALHGGQLRTTVTLTGFQDIQKVAAKIGIWEATLGRVFKNQLVDNLMGVIKPGWLITGTNVVRNAGEDLFGAAVRGEYGDVVKAKTIAESKGLLPKRTKLGNIVIAPLARVAQLVRRAGMNPDDEKLGLGYIAKLDPDVTHAIADHWTQLHAGSMIDPAGLQDVDSITKAGYVPREFRMQRTGYGMVDTDGQQGAERLANALGIAINKTPGHTKAILDHIEDPELFPIEHVVSSLKDKANAKWVSQMTRAGVYRGEDGLWHKAVTEADKELALRQLANDQVLDLKYLLGGADGKLNQELADYIRVNEKAPNASWIMDKLASAEKRPVTVHAPMYEPVPVEKGVTGFVGAIADVAGNGYRHLVERSIARISSMPIFLSHYGKARYELRGIEKAMVDEGGLTAEAADTAAQKLAMEMAFNRTVKYIDDAGLRTQMDIVGRNFFAFSRATQAFMRRWGTQFIEDPARLRKAMLTMESAEHAGIVYTDPNGQKQFMFPGSGAAIEAFQHLESALSLGGRIPGLDVMQVPVAADLTGKVALLQPGLQNPMQMSLTPMVNIPMRAVFDLFPEHRQALDEVDTFLNGPQGQGQSLFNEVLPTAIKKFTDALDSNDRDSMTASATRQAILNLAAAGKLPKDGADAAQIDDFLQNLKVQVKNQLVLRAVFGFFTPAPPGQPSEQTDGSKADWFYGALGVRGLSDEWKTLLNQTGGDIGKATAIWSELHPDKTFYTVGTTESTTKSATVNATRESEAWLENHLDFMRAYKGVSAYFIPKAVQGGDFDLGAYNSQLELGLRQHKDLSQFYTDVRIKHAEDLYFDALDKRDKAIADTPTTAKLINKRFSSWYANFRALNPLFAQKMSDFSSQVVTAQNQLATLRRLVKDRPAGIEGLDVVANMVDAYDKFHAVMEKYKGSSNVDQAVHSSLRTQYNDWMQQAVSESPQFKGLYQGVFRTLDTQALQSMGTTL